ncbi:MAG: glycosyltransferase family 4 protein [Ancrocorticia sp.]
MRIGYFLLDPGIGVFGTKGASVHVQEVIRALRAAGHEVIVFCTKVDHNVPEDLADLEIHRVPVPRSVSAAQREQALIENTRVAVRRAQRANLDCVYERYSLFSAAGAELASAEGIPLILEVNAPLIDEQRQYRELVDHEAALRLSRQQFATASLITCVSQPVADWVAETMRGADAGTGANGSSLPAGDANPFILVLPNGVNTERIRPVSSSGAHKQDSQLPLTVGFVGTLKPWHGTENLIRALHKTSEPMELTLCGDGPDRQMLEQLAEDLGVIDRVHFLGAVSPADIPLVLGCFDIAVAPYPQGDHYFSPLKVYEYMAAGLPVVASDIGEIPGLLEGGECGMLVRPGDVGALAAALDRLASDAELRRQLGHRARQAAQVKHDWQVRVERVLTCIDA